MENEEWRNVKCRNGGMENGEMKNGECGNEECKMENGIKCNKRIGGLVAHLSCTLNRLFNFNAFGVKKGLNPLPI
jgi:hypothetical protein